MTLCNFNKSQCIIQVVNNYLFMKTYKFIKYLKSGVKAFFSYRFLTVLFFIGYAICSVKDANARILITDPALYLFNIINDNDFVLIAERYTSVINQFLVVFSVRLNIPLRYIIPIYSVSFVFIRFLYFFLADFVFKNRAAGFAIIAFSTLGVAESYFRPTSESTIAMLNSALLFAFLFYSEQKDFGRWKLFIQIFGTILFVFFGFFTHPIALFSLFFVICYFSFANQKFKDFYPYVTIVFTLLLFMIKVFFTDSDGHHGSLFGNLTISPFIILKELQSYYPYKFFMNFFYRLYLPGFIMFVAGSLLLLSVRKRLTSTIFAIIFVIVYFIIACTSFKEGDANMQMEKIFLPLFMFSALAFSDGVSIIFKNKFHIHLIIVVLIALLGYFSINKVRPLYKGRIEYLKEIIVKADVQGGKKMIINSDQLNRKIVFTWAMGIESLMLSSINENIETLTVYCIQGYEKLEGKRDKPDNFIVAPFQTSYDYSRLNSHYFTLPEQDYIDWKENLK